MQEAVPGKEAGQEAQQEVKDFLLAPGNFRGLFVIQTGVMSNTVGIQVGDKIKCSFFGGTYVRRR